MKNCPNCGAALTEGEKVCSVCGYVLQQKILRGDLTTSELSDDRKAEQVTDATKADHVSLATDAVTEAKESSVIATTGTHQEEAAEPEKTVPLASEKTSVPRVEEEPSGEQPNDELPTKASTPEVNSEAVAQPSTTATHPENDLEQSPRTKDDPSTEKAATPREPSFKTFAKNPDLTVLPGGKEEDEDDDGLTPGDYVLNYFRFINRQIMSPNFKQIGHATKSEKWYGLASFLVIVLSNGFALSRLLTSLIYRILGVMQSFGLQFQYREGSNLLFFFELSLYLAVAGAVYWLAYYLVAGKVFGRPVQFLQALGELMAPASLAVFLSLAAVGFTLLLSDLSQGILTLVVASLLLLGVSFIGNLWQTPNLTGRFNRFYTILLTSLVCLLVLIAVSRFFVTGILQDLPIQQVPTGIEDLFGESDLFY